MAKKQDYAAAQKAWLKAKASHEGVLPLTDGIYYKVLQQGRADGIHPSPQSIITAHYTGWTTNGRKFDSSRGGAPLCCRLRELIPGWITAIRQMCIGDKWEIYIPAEQAYGRYASPGIPAYSTLIFEVELIGIA